MNKSLSKIEPTIARWLLGLLGLLLVALGYAALTSGWANQLLLNTLGIDPQAPPTPDWQTNLIIFGRGMLLRGLIMLLALLLLLLPWRTTLAALLARDRWLLPLATLALLVCWLPVLLVGYSETIDNTRYWWLFDDAMISMRYARNFAAGDGLVWNPGGERVEGYTNFLWVIYMALIHLLPIPLHTTSLVITLTNIALAIATLPLLLRIIAMLEGGRLARVAAVTTFLLSLNTMGWATAGAETMLLSFLLMLGIYLVLRDVQRGSPSWLPYLVGGLMALVRSDALLLALGLYGMAFWLHRNKQRVIIYSLTALLLPLAHIGFRLRYYGELLPNTAHLKVTNWDNKIPHGIDYVLAFLNDYALLTIFATIGALVSRSAAQRLLLLIVLGYSAYVAYAGGDGFPQYRFFVPILPLIIVLAFIGVRRMVPWLASRLMLATVCLISIPLLVPGTTTPLYPHEVAVGNIEIGRLYAANAPPDSKVADFWAGIVFYYSDVQGIDLLGKNDAHIARLPALYGDIPGHNKFDFDYSLLQLKPDYVNASFALPVDVAQLQEWRQSEAPWRGELYFNATFREHCFPYPIELPTWRTIFVCDWSPQLEQRNTWHMEQ
jgi:hypothetical protein